MVFLDTHVVSEAWTGVGYSSPTRCRRDHAPITAALARNLRPVVDGRGVPRLALRWPGEVATALGVGDDFVKRHGLISELRAVRLGSQRFVPVSEIERWLTENARLPLDDAPAERRSA